MSLRKRGFIILPIVGILFLLMHSCNKKVTDDSATPHNPYDDINRTNDTTTYGIPLDSLTITYLHKKVLSSRCALPGCHDGHFEPDFRTPQSSFSTLIYAPIIKNSSDSAYTYRVIPFDTTHSVFYQRVINCCFVNQNDRMPQDGIGIPLPDSSLNLIASWIMHGSRDMFGNVPRLPNKEPVVQYYLAVDTLSLIPPYAFPTRRYDTVRADGVFYNPFIVPASKNVFYMFVIPQDDSTELGSLQYNKLKISTDADNFTSATQYSASYITIPGFKFWLLTIPTNNLPANDTLYMRYYVNDGSHAANTEFPKNGMPYAYKTFWSFIRR